MTGINSSVATALLDYVENKKYGVGFDPANPTNGLPYAMPGVSFDPSQMPQYISVAVNFGQPGVKSTSGGFLQKMGLLTLTVFYPKSIPGIIKPGAIADEIETDWPQARNISFGSKKIIIGTTYQVGPIEDTVRNSIPVIIPWQVLDKA